jgi:hypothetical protein
MAAAQDDKAAWLERVLGLRIAGGSGLDDALAGWEAARGTALASLKALEGAFRGMKHPATDPAIILLRAIQANLTAAPTTPQQVKELATYLTTDSIIKEAEMPNGFGFTVELRAPLMAALAVLHRQLGAGGRA